MINADVLKEVIRIYNGIYKGLDEVLVGQGEVKKVVTSALLCDRNSKILLMGNTGTGKTTLANYLGNSLQREKIAVTSDLLPSDVQSQLLNHSDFNLLHIDEFNRASGKLQSAFLELFAERTISYNGVSKQFGDFYVFATQNSADIAGIFNVPQAVYDRIDASIYFGNLTSEEKRQLLFSGFTPLAKGDIDLAAIDYTTKAVEDFSLTEEEQDLLIAAFNVIDDLHLNGNRLFAGSNIRAHKYAIKLAKINAMQDGRTSIKPSDLADYIKFVYLHRIDQSVESINNPDVYNLLGKASSDILSLKRRRGLY